MSSEQTVAGKIKIDQWRRLVTTECEVNFLTKNKQRHGFKFDASSFVCFHLWGFPFGGFPIYYRQLELGA